MGEREKSDQRRMHQMFVNYKSQMEEENQRRRTAFQEEVEGADQ